MRVQPARACRVSPSVLHAGVAMRQGQRHEQSSRRGQCAVHTESLRSRTTAWCQHLANIAGSRTEKRAGPEQFVQARQRANERAAVMVNQHVSGVLATASDDSQHAALERAAHQTSAQPKRTAQSHRPSVAAGRLIAPGQQAACSARGLEVCIKQQRRSAKLLAARAAALQIAVIAGRPHQQPAQVSSQISSRAGKRACQTSEHDRGTHATHGQPNNSHANTVQTEHKHTPVLCCKCGRPLSDGARVWCAFSIRRQSK